MNPSEILEHFLARADWVNPGKTADRLIMCDPEEDFDRCLVTWMPRMKALRKMVARGVRLLITHEPTFWHIKHDVPPATDDGFGGEKAAFIRKYGLTAEHLPHGCTFRPAGHKEP